MDGLDEEAVLASIEDGFISLGELKDILGEDILDLGLDDNNDNDNDSNNDDNDNDELDAINNDNDNDNYNTSMITNTKAKIVV